MQPEEEVGAFPVEVTTRFATSVNSVQEAFVFIMDRLDKVGPYPSIEITPIWTVSFDLEEGETSESQRFSVVVSGMVEEDDGS